MRKPALTRKWRMRRFCYLCRLPILRNHRWHIDGCFIRHDDCSNPSPAREAPLLQLPKEGQPV